MVQKPPEHYGREAYQLLDGMREAMDEIDDIPDDLVADVDDAMQEIRVLYMAARDFREGEVDA